MIIGNTESLKYTITRTTNFQVESGAVTIATAAGSTVIPITDSVPGTPALIQDVKTDYTPTVAGHVALEWVITLSDSAVVSRRERSFVFWSDVPGGVRALLQMDATQLPDEIVWKYFSNRLGRFYREYTGLAMYDVFPEEYVQFLDDGLSHYTAADLRPHLPKTGATGELEMFWRGSARYQYGRPVNVSSKPLLNVEDHWKTLGLSFLLNIPAVAAIEDVRGTNYVLLPTRGIHSVESEL